MSPADSGEANRLKMVILTITLEASISPPTHFKIAFYTFAGQPRLGSVLYVRSGTVLCDSTRLLPNFLAVISPHTTRKKNTNRLSTRSIAVSRLCRPRHDLIALSGTFIEQWAAHLRRRMLPASIRRKMVALRVFSSYWVRKGLLTESPFWRVNSALDALNSCPGV